MDDPTGQPGSMRVALVSTAAVGAPGSMRAYADLLMSALGEHAPHVQARLIEVDPVPAAGAIARRARTLGLPFRVRRWSRPAPDVWHVLDGSRAHVARWLGTAPVVITVHDIIPRLQQRGQFPGAPSVGLGSRWLWNRNGSAMERADALVCDSECTRSDVASEFGVPPDTRVVPLPVRPSLTANAGLAPSDAREKGVVLHVGNNGFYKQRDQALRVFAATEREIASRLTMLGPAPTPTLLDLASGLGISERIDWVEDASDTALSEWYRRASVLVFPSLYEGYGWPVLEAMTFGLPVVSSNGGSLPEVVGDVAPCFAPQDVSGFAREVEALLRDPGFAVERAKRGLERAQQFGLARFAREMSDVYRSACNGRAVGAR